MLCQQNCGKIPIFVSSDKNSEKGTPHTIILHMENTARRGAGCRTFPSHGAGCRTFSSPLAPPRGIIRAFSRNSQTPSPVRCCLFFAPAPRHIMLYGLIFPAAGFYSLCTPRHNRRPSVSLLPAACGAVTLPALYPAARSDVGQA